MKRIKDKLDEKYFLKGKKGISPMIGYILLIVFAIIISASVFQWMRTYLPAQTVECPEGVSIFISEATYEGDTQRLNITLRNNGRHSISGYFVYTRNATETLATNLVSKDFVSGKFGGESNRVFGDVRDFVYFLDMPPRVGEGLPPAGKNNFYPGNQTTNIFSVSEHEPFEVRILPVRFETVGTRSILTRCSNAIVTQRVT